MTGGLRAVYGNYDEQNFRVGGVAAPAQYLMMRIARYKVPRQFVFLDALPRTPYGKVEKARLRASLA